MPRSSLQAARRPPIWWPLAPTLLAALTALAPAAAAAPVARWTALGPNGGGVLCLAADRAGRVLYAGTSGGVYRSADGGAGWTLLARQIGRQAIVALAVDPLRSSNLYAGTATQGVWKSRDGGATWAPAVRGLPSKAVASLAIDPVRSNVLYAGLADRPGPWKSLDGGATWRAAGAGLRPDRVVSLAVDPANPSVVLAARPLLGLARSADGGATWTEIAGVPQAVRVGAALDGSALYAVQPAGAGPAELYRSADGGVTWTRISPGGSGLDYPLGIGPGGILYTQGWTSGDGGLRWTATAPVAPEDGELHALLVTPTAPRTVYAASGRGLFKTVNGAASWAGASRGLVATGVAALAVDPQGGTILAGVAGSGLLRNRRSSIAWQALLSETPGFVVVDPSRPKMVYAGIAGLSSMAGREGGDRILQTTDGGATWRTLPLADPCLELADLAVDPANPDVLYAGGRPSEVDPRCVGGDSVAYRSADGGESWIRMQIPQLERVLVDPFDPATVYALVYPYQFGLYRSLDHGATWSPASGGLDTAVAILDLALDASGPGRLYATSSNGVYATVDGARSWQLINDRLPGATVLRVEPAAPRTLYAGVPGRGVLVSRDAGFSWSPLDDGHLSALFSGALELDPSRPGTLYVGTQGAGVFRVEIPPLR